MMLHGNNYLTKESLLVIGGTGFIGRHFAKYLLDNNVVENIYLADIKHIRSNSDFIDGRIKNFRKVVE